MRNIDAIEHVHTHTHTHTHTQTHTDTHTHTHTHTNTDGQAERQTDTCMEKVPRAIIAAPEPAPAMRETLLPLTKNPMSPPSARINPYGIVKQNAY